MSDINQALLDGLNRIEDKCDKIVDRVAGVEQKQAVSEERQKRHSDNMERVATEIHEIKKTLDGQHEQLVDHVSRSNTLQSNQEQFTQALEDIVARLRPLEEQKEVSVIIEEYEQRKRQKLINLLKDWKTIMTVIMGTGAFVAWLLGYFK